MKKFLSFVLCLVMLFSLAACGQEKQPEENPGKDNENNVTQSKEAKAFEKLKNIIIEKGTKTEENAYIKYTYNYLGNEFAYEILNSSDTGWIDYHVDFDDPYSATGVLSLNEEKDKTFTAYSIVTDLLNDLGVITLKSGDSDRSAYNSKTGLKDEELDYSMSNLDEEDSRKACEAFIYATVCSFYTTVDSLGIDARDFGFASLFNSDPEVPDETNNNPTPNNPETPVTPNFEPLEYSGTGDKVITDVNLPEGEFVAKIEMKNGGHLAVKYHYNDTYALLVNDSYNYSGTTLIKEGNTFAVSDGYLEVESGGGSWNIKIEPLSGEIEGNSVSGKGDVVTGLFNGTGKKAVFKSKITTDRHTAIKVYKYNGKRYESELLVNEIGNYEGEKLFKLDAGAKYFFAVESEGDWSISWE